MAGYVFDLTSAFTKIPPVILLLLLGWGAKEIVMLFKTTLPDLTPLLPALGTIGLILIVLEGALELELNKSKVNVIGKSAIVALLPIFITSFTLGWALQYFSGFPYKTAVLNAIPFAVISSSVAIPSVRNLSAAQREFVIYESSLSDIFGVLFFNFIAFNATINAQSFGNFTTEVAIIVVISFVSVLALSFLLSRIQHHITYTPIILLVILIYAVSKLYHLPGLVFILVFGLFLGNLEELKGFSWIEKFRPEKLEKEVLKFKEITIEATFMVRALFFLLFGFLMDAREILNLDSIPWSVFIVASIFLVRSIILYIARLPLLPLLFVAPRGLITVLLFLSIVPEQAIPFVNKGLIIQTIVLSVLVMMFGLIATKRKVE